MSKRRRNRGIPNDVDGLLAIRTAFFAQQLKLLVKSIFEIKCPEYWDKDYMLNLLCFDGGYFGVLDTGIAGVFPLQCGVYGQNFFNRPTNITVSNYMLPETIERKIDKDCVLVYLDSPHPTQFYTFNQLVNVYAEQLASAHGSIDVNLITSRLGYIAEAESRAQAETLKKIIDDITSGEPVVVCRSDSLSPKGLQVFFQNASQNFIVDKLQDAKASIMHEFLTYIGLNNANTDKKERLITDEVNANNEELKANIDVFKWHLEDATKKVNKMFPDIEFSIKIKEPESVQPLNPTRGDITNEFTRDK